LRNASFFFETAVGGFELYREYEANGQTVELERESIHVMDDARRIALVETQTVGGSDQLIRYQLSNHLGSSSLELDEFGDLISYEEYHPYGTTAFQAGRSAAEVSLKRYRYTAKERDDESGLNYHGARYYAPWLGRWTSAGPAGMVDGTNLYKFSRSNPIIYNDPNGLNSEVDFNDKDIQTHPEAHVIIGEPPAASSSVDDATMGQYVDSFEGENIYDPNYRSENGSYSEWLRLQYADGLSIDININDISEDPSSFNALEIIMNAEVGEGGRVFPSELNAQTTPRLAEEKKKALQRMRDDYDLIRTSFFSVFKIVAQRPGIRGGSKPTSGGKGPLAANKSKPITKTGQNSQATIDAVPRGGTYVLRDPITGQVMRTGRTGDLGRRAAEHARNPRLKDFTFEPMHRTDNYAEQRGLEQLLHEIYQPPLNKINPINPRNSRLNEYIEAAKQFQERNR
jgi:RHS repeat-associated protein